MARRITGKKNTGAGGPLRGALVAESVARRLGYTTEVWDHQGCDVITLGRGNPVLAVGLAGNGYWAGIFRSKKDLSPRTAIRRDTFKGLKNLAVTVRRWLRELPLMDIRGELLNNPEVDPKTLERAADMIKSGKLDKAAVGEIAAAVKAPKNASRAEIAKRVEAVGTQVAVKTASSVGVPESVTRAALKVSTAIQTAPFRAAKWAYGKVKEKMTKKNPKRRAQRNPVWTRAYINKLPDSAFLYVETGGTKDEQGKTVPRGLRHFPVRDLQGRVSEAHARNAISRIPQSTAKGLTRPLMKKLQDKARSLLFFGAAKDKLGALKKPLPTAKGHAPIAANPGLKKFVPWKGAKKNASSVRVVKHKQRPANTTPPPKVAKKRSAKRNPNSAAVWSWLEVLKSKLTQYDRRLSMAERKRRIPENIYRLSHYLGAAQEIEKECKKYLQRDDAEALAKFERSMLAHFSDTMPPVKNVQKQLAQYKGAGTMPSLVGNPTITSQLRRIGGFTYEGTYYRVAERPRSSVLVWQAKGDGAKWSYVGKTLKSTKHPLAFRKLLAQHAGVKMPRVWSDTHAGVRRSKRTKKATRRNASRIAPHMWVISKDSTGRFIVSIGDPRKSTSTLKRRFATLADLKSWVKYDMPQVVSPTHVHDATGLGLLKGGAKKNAVKRNSGEADIHSGDFRGWEAARAMGEWTYSRTWAGHYVSVTETPDPPRSGLYRYRVFIDDKRLGKVDFREVKQVFAAIKKAIGPLRKNPAAATKQVKQLTKRVKRLEKVVTRAEKREAKEHGTKAPKLVKRNAAPRQPTKAQLDRVKKVARACWRVASKYCPSVKKVTIKLNPKQHDTARHFAATAVRGPQAIIQIAPELALAPAAVIVGIMRHEFGHLVQMACGAKAPVKPPKSKAYDAIERHADRIAEKVFKTKIFYDSRGVEVSGPGAKGKRPRPAGLR